MISMYLQLVQREHAAINVSFAKTTLNKLAVSLETLNVVRRIFDSC